MPNPEDKNSKFSDFNSEEKSKAVESGELSKKPRASQDPKNPTVSQDSVDPSSKSRKAIAPWKIIAPILAILLLIGIVIWAQGRNRKTEDPTASNSSSSTSTFAVVISQEKKTATPSNKENEKLEQVLNAELKARRKSGNPKCTIECEFEWYMGWVSVEAMKNANVIIPKFDPTKTGYETVPDTLLDNFIPAPIDPNTGACKDKKDYLWYEAQKIEVPIVQTGLEDMFAKNEDGTLNYSQVVSKNFEDYADAGPIQQKLRSGAVHLAISPQPGNIGNAYISGHSSNNPDPKGNNKYNEVFKPIMDGALGKGGAKTGEKFIICDFKGRKLQFNIFEVKAYTDGSETNEMWKYFTDKRVVSLQASIRTPEDVAAKRGPSKRAIVRGELMMEESKKLNPATKITTPASTAASNKK